MTILELKDIVDSAKLYGGIKGINATRVVELEKGGEAVLVKILRIMGKYKNNPDRTINLLVILKKDELVFHAGTLDEIEASDDMMTVYLDANGGAQYGAHLWDDDDNKVHYRYILPLPDAAKGFVTQELVARVLTDTYKALLFPEYSKLQVNLKKLPFSEEEIEVKEADLEQTYKDLTGKKGVAGGAAAADNDGSVI